MCIQWIFFCAGLDIYKTVGLVNLRDHLAKLGLQFKTVVAEDFLPEYNSSKTFAEEDFHRSFAVQNSGGGVYSTRVLQFKTFAAEDFFSRRSCSSKRLWWRIFYRSATVQ